MNPVRRFRAPLALLTPLVFCLAFPVSAQTAEGSKAPAKETKDSKDARTQSLSDKFDGVEFRTIGPFRGGRVTAVTGVPSAPQTFYFGATGGGVWKTTDGGSNWQVALRQGLQDRVDRRDRRLGVRSERRVRRHGRGADPRQRLHGDGVYKSTDAGRDLEERRPARYAADRPRPRSTRRIPTSFTSRRRATSGGPTPSAASSVPRTAGRPGRRSSTSTRRPGASDLAMDPSNPRILYAAFWQVVRHPWELGRGGPGSQPLEVHRRRRHLEEADRRACPRASWGKVGVAVSPRIRAASYAFVEARRGGPLPQRGLRREVDARQRRAQDPRARLVLLVDLPGPEERRRRLPAERPDAQVDRRRQDVLERCHVPHGDNHDMWIDSGRSRAASSSATTAARRSPTTAARAGPRCTTSRRRSSTA